MRKEKTKAILFAVLAAVFYAINMPVSKSLLKVVAPTMMAGLLYLGAGIGIGILFLFKKQDIKKEDLLSKEDLPYTLGMIALDIIAPIFLMFGLTMTTSANASLLNNFEIVATTLIAWMVFQEVISNRLWIAIFLITLSSVMLSFEDMSSLRFTWGSLFVLLAAVCWGMENNFTRKLSTKNTTQIVMLKGVFSGLGSFVIALFIRESIPKPTHLFLVLLLGFVAYGLSILFYILAQRTLGAAKTSAYYAIAPFVGVLLSVVFLKESLTSQYILSLVIMFIGSSIVVIDTLLVRHKHVHVHEITHTHDGTTHRHRMEHSHEHHHIKNENQHTHEHPEPNAFHTGPC